MKTKTIYFPLISAIENAAKLIKDVVAIMPLQLNTTASNKMEAKVYLKERIYNWSDHIKYVVPIIKLVL